jgi:3-oxoacyl-(acyl-carrier-protein) synthase
MKRRVEPIALLSGYGNVCDAFHQTASSPNGEGAFGAMAQALDQAGIDKGKVDYINAHGTGTPNNDLSESIAIKRLFGDRIPPVSSTKAFTGHTTSASGAIEAVICMLAMRNRFLPVSLNWKNKMENGIIPVSNSKPAAPIGHVLCNSFGFGGNDSSLLLTHPLVS